MPIVHGPRPTRDFTVISNAIITDRRLSLEARLILIYLLSKPADWTVSTQDLVNLSQDSVRPSGLKVIYAAIRELTTAGYVSSRRLNRGGVEYTVFDRPRAGIPDEILASQPLGPKGEVAIEPLGPKGEVDAGLPLGPSGLVPKRLVPNAHLVITEEVQRTEKAQKPKSAPSASRKRKGEEVTLSEFISRCKSLGEKAIPESDPILAYAEKAGIPHETLLLAWRVFKERFLDDESKTYADWRKAFRNYVKNGWLGLWFFDSGTGECRLTTAGEQARRIQERTPA